MIKAGYSGMGFWVAGPQMVGSLFHQNLKPHHQNLLSYNTQHACHTGNVIMEAMEEWVKENCA